MKFVVLLALVGLASCRTTLVGGERARDVTIEYSYWDDQGKEVTVEVKADELGLDFSKDGSKLSLKKPSSTSATWSGQRQRMKVDDFSKPETRTRFVQVERERRPTSSALLQVGPQPAPRRQVETRFVQVKPQLASRPHVRTQLVQVQAQLAPRPEVETRFVQVQAQPAPRPEVETRFVQVLAQPAPQPEVETRFVQVQAQLAPRPEVETRFVQVQAQPAPLPEVETRYVQVAAKPIPQSVHFLDADDFRAPALETEVRFIQVEAVPESRPEVETRFVHVEAPRQKGLTHFVQAEPIPARRPVSRTQYVEVERPVAFQTVRHPARPSAPQFRVPHSVSPVRSSSSAFDQQPSRKSLRQSHGFSEDDDNSSEK